MPTGSQSAVLDTVTPAGDGVVAISGASTHTLQDIRRTQRGGGLGQNALLPAVAQTASGTVRFVLVQNAALEAVTGVASGTIVVYGRQVITLAGIGNTASATTQTSAGQTAVLANIGRTQAAGVQITGASAVTLGQVFSGVPIRGNQSVTLEDAYNYYVDWARVDDLYDTVWTRLYA